MPPWLNWLDWLKWDCVGAGIIGKVLGLWFSCCVSVPRSIFRRVRNSIGRVTNRGNSGGLHRQVLPQDVFFRRLSKAVISTSLTLSVWCAITWKPVWTAAGIEGDRILTAILLLVSVSWVISLIWICFSKSGSNESGRRQQSHPSNL